MWRFTTVPASTPLDSTIAPLADFGTFDLNRLTWSCGALSSTGSAIGVPRFQFGGVPDSLVVDDAWVLISPNGLVASNALPALFFIANHVVPCGVPPVTPVLGSDFPIADGSLTIEGRLWYESPILASQVQGRIWRRPELSDYALATHARLSYITSGAAIHIRYYRVGSGARPRF